MRMRWRRVLIETLWNVKLIVVTYLDAPIEVLIETLWNVKLRISFFRLEAGVSFNRNIVECKEFCKICFCPGILGFNRNIVECKVPTEDYTAVTNQSFNRNIVECKEQYGWNILRYWLGFNRNIVECKGKCQSCFMLFAICFNRNIVECKVSIALTSDPCMQVLIETLWNVKKNSYQFFIFQRRF